MGNSVCHGLLRLGGEFRPEKRGLLQRIFRVTHGLAFPHRLGRGDNTVAASRGLPQEFRLALLGHKQGSLCQRLFVLGTGCQCAGLNGNIGVLVEQTDHILQHVLGDRMCGKGGQRPKGNRVEHRALAFCGFQLLLGGSDLSFLGVIVSGFFVFCGLCNQGNLQRCFARQSCRFDCGTILVGGRSPQQGHAFFLIRESLFQVFKICLFYFEIIVQGGPIGKQDGQFIRALFRFFPFVLDIGPRGFLAFQDRFSALQA